MRKSRGNFAYIGVYGEQRRELLPKLICALGCRCVDIGNNSEGWRSMTWAVPLPSPTHSSLRDGSAIKPFMSEMVELRLPLMSPVEKSVMRWVWVLFGERHASPSFCEKRTTTEGIACLLPRRHDLKSSRCHCTPNSGRRKIEPLYSRECSSQQSMPWHCFEHQHRSQEDKTRKGNLHRGVQCILSRGGYLYSR